MNAYLGKWPTMIVEGESVTHEQANEILIRTMSRRYWSSTNNKAWSNALNKIIGYNSSLHSLPNIEDRFKALEENEKIMDSLGVLHLNYLYNSQIASAYIFGAHGWMDWDGNITGNAVYNVGKWPEEDELLEEWKQIAAAFPYLKMKIQFLADEDWSEKVEQAPTIAFEVHIANGEATAANEFSSIMEGRAPSAEDLFDSLKKADFREQGVTLERFIEAVNQVRS